MWVLVQKRRREKFSPLLRIKSDALHFHNLHTLLQNEMTTPEFLLVESTILCNLLSNGNSKRDKEKEMAINFLRNVKNLLSSVDLLHVCLFVTDTTHLCQDRF